MSSNPLTSLPVQEQLGWEVSEADWKAVKELLRQVHEDEAIVTRVGQWVSVVALYRSLEDHVMRHSSKSLKTMAGFRELLEAMMAMGGLVCRDAAKIDEAHWKALGLDPRNLDALLHELQMHYMAQYGDMRPEERAHILQEVFGVESGPARKD